MYVQSLSSRIHYLVRFTNTLPNTVKTAAEVRDQLEFLQNKLDCCLVIDGESLQVGPSVAVLDPLVANVAS